MNDPTNILTFLKIESGEQTESNPRIVPAVTVLNMLEVLGNTQQSLMYDTLCHMRCHEALEPDTPTKTQ